MKKLIAFLRAINVGGHNVIKMEDLKKIFEDLGFKNVSTYIQSGNVFFETDLQSDDASKKVEEELKKQGKDVKVITKTIDDLNEIVKNEPFSGIKHLDNVLYITFLESKPKFKVMLPFKSSNGDVEVVLIKNQVAYSIARKVKDKYGNPNKLLENQLQVVATTRNLKVIKEIIKQIIKE